jgi:hypothetical protein
MNRRRYSSPRVMDQRIITWTQWSNRLTPRPPRPRHPSDPAPPVWPRPARSTLRLLTHVARPRTARHRAPTSSAPCLPRRRAPLPATPHAAPSPTSAPTSPSHRLSRQCPCLLRLCLSHQHHCLLRPCASQNDWENHKMTEEITKSLRKI